MDEYISAKEAAKILGLSSGYVTQLSRQGKFDLTLSASKTGPRNSWQIPLKGVEAYMKEKDGGKVK